MYILYMYIYVYIYIYIYILYLIMKTVCLPVPVITTMALWHNRTSRAQVYELIQSHCGDNREGTLFS